MPRSLGFGLSKHHEACHGVWPNQPISAPPGTCSWPSKAQPVLDPACPWLPVRSWPAPRLLSRGLLPSTPAGKTSPRPEARRPNAHGSRLPVAASRPAARSPLPSSTAGARREDRALPTAGNARAPARGHHVGHRGRWAAGASPGGCPPCGPAPAPHWPEGHSRPGFSSHTYLHAPDISFRRETSPRQTPLPETSARAPIGRAASLTHRGSARSDLAAAAAAASAAASADNMADLQDGGLTGTNIYTALNAFLTLTPPSLLEMTH